MKLRTHHRISTATSTWLWICIVAFFAVWLVEDASHFLREQWAPLPAVTLGAAALGPVLFAVWYFSCHASVYRGELRIRWFWRVQHVDLKRLEAAEVLAAGGRRGRTLAMRLEDQRGAQLWLPLLAWRDENLLMARVLRATVDCSVQIDGDPLLVRRFAGVLDSYKSWDHQLAA